ncbi:hypothetical protein CCP3SC1AL1_310005 [Gammaproteobacteria bacterium]
MIYGLNITFKKIKIMSSEFKNKKINKYAFTAATTVAIVSTTSPISPTTGAVSTITKTAHGLKTGDVVSVVTGTTLPTGLAADTAYYVYKVDDNSFKLATTWALAIASTPNVAITSQGTGTQTFRKNGYGVCHTGIFLPDNALITLATTNPLVNFASTAATISITCNAQDIKTATAYNNGAWTAITNHISTTPLYLTAEAEVLITIAGGATGALTAGTYDLWIEYNI